MESGPASSARPQFTLMSAGNGDIAYFIKRTG